MLGSQNRAQSHICGNKCDLINHMVSGLNHAPFSKCLPTYLSDSYMSSGTSACLYFIPASATGGLREKTVSGVQLISVHRGSVIWDLKASRLRRRGGQGKETKGQKQPYPSPSLPTSPPNPHLSLLAR